MYSRTFLCRYFLRLIFTSPFFYEVVHISKLFFYLIWISRRLIYFINCKYNRNTCSRSMIYSFDSLRHHIIICSNNNNSNICYLSATSTHSRKCLMSWSIQESNTTAIFQFYIIRSYMLGNSSRFTGNNISIPDIIKQ